MVNYQNFLKILSFYYSELENFVKLSFLWAENLRVGVAEGTISFLNFLDGMLVELIYSSIEKFDLRLDVSWKIFLQGISKWRIATSWNEGGYFYVQK